MRFTLRHAAIALILLALGYARSFNAALTLDTNPLWTATPGQAAYPFLTTDSTQRGIAYNPATGNVLVVSRATGNTGIFVLNGSTGAVIGQLNITGITGGTFAENLIGVGEDGAIYVANLTTASATPATPFKVYRYASEASGLTTGGNLAPANVYSGDPTGGTGARYGDTLDVRGLGASTQILVGSRSSALSTILNANNALASSFTAQLVTTDYTNGNLGVAFGSGSQFYSKLNASTALRQVAVSGTAGTTTLTGTVVGQTSGMDVDTVDNLIGLVSYSTASTPFNTSLYLYDITDPANPALLASRDFPTNVVDANGVGAVAFGSNGVVYALVTNNGIVAYQLVPEPACVGLLAVVGLGVLGRRRNT